MKFTDEEIDRIIEIAGKIELHLIQLNINLD